MDDKKSPPKKEKIVNKVYQIQIPMEIEAKTVLRLTEHIGEGSWGDTKVDISGALDRTLTFIEVDGTKYMVQLKHIIQAVIESHEKNNPPKK